MKEYLEKYGFIDRVDISGEHYMSLEITHLGSGSRGNCAIINSDDSNPISVPKAKAILTTVSIPSIYNQ